jgi:hypothetical protein
MRTRNNFESKDEKTSTVSFENDWCNKRIITQQTKVSEKWLSACVFARSCAQVGFGQRRGA